METVFLVQLPSISFELTTSCLVTLRNWDPMGKCFSSTHPSTEYGALGENVLEEMLTFVSSVENPQFGQKRELRIYTSFETSSGFGSVLHGRIFPVC
jgi:hypothetical protein